MIILCFYSRVGVQEALSIEMAGCKKKFYFYNYGHVALGYESDKFTCDQCPAKMRSKKALMNHVNRIHGDSKVDGSGEKVVEMTDCTKCDRQVKTSKLLLHYKRSHSCLPPGHEPGSFMCDQCPAELQSRVIYRCTMYILISL